jgi:hypothetical protein
MIVGGSMATSPASARATASAGLIHMVWSASPETSRVTCPPGSAATKK